jgi:CBS domain-containing protein
VGVVHFSDVRDVMYDPALSALVTAVDLADPDSKVVPADMPLADLLDAFTAENVGVLPVVHRAQDRHVVGLVEQRDLFRALRLPRDARRTES